MIFASLVFLMGGGSRYDIESVGPLRALAAVFLAIAIWWQDKTRLATVRTPLLLLAALAFVMVAQLIPLPPSLWQSLSNREEIAAIEATLGLGEVWRPVTLSPLRTANSLASLIVPAAGLLLLSLLDRESVRKLRRFVIVVGVVSAVLGIAQIVVRSSPGLYLYEITNPESAVGLFSNRNHNALFLNIALLFCVFEISKSKLFDQAGSGSVSQLHPLVIAAGVILYVGVLINASRFGLVLLALNTAIFGWFVFAALRRAGNSRARLRKWVIGALAMVGVAALALIAAFSRIPALERAFSSSLADEQRLQTLPIITDLLRDHFPFGVGFGAFEQAFRIVEPADMLRPRYLNHAHNDWLQILVEGGLAAIVIVVLALAWLAKSLLAIRRVGVNGSGTMQNAVLGLLTILMIALHSVVDYPLRTPSLMLVGVFAVFLISRGGQRARQRLAGQAGE